MARDRQDEAAPFTPAGAPQPGACAGEQATQRAHAGEPCHVLVVCDNTMGIPGGEIDDGLALLYLLGCPDRVRIEAVGTTHGNAPLAATDRATRALCAQIAPCLPVLRGAEPDADDTSRGDAGDVAPAIIALAQQGGACLLSLGATTDLARAERLHPGTLAGFDAVSLMGGITRPLAVGGRAMDELNFSADAAATRTALAAALPRQGRRAARLLIADAHHCLPVFFAADEFLARMAAPGLSGAALIERTCTPWIERMRSFWSTDGFVAWDVLAAVALAEPELVELVPYEVALDETALSRGMLVRPGGSKPASADGYPAAPGSHLAAPGGHLAAPGGHLAAPGDRLATPGSHPAAPGDGHPNGSAGAPVALVAPRDPTELREHVYAAWHRALATLR